MGVPAYLPDFNMLTRQILNLDSEEKFDSADQKLGEGFDLGVKIHEQCIRILKQDNPKPTQLHHDILKLFPKVPREITTNFYFLFEVVVCFDQEQYLVNSLIAFDHDGILHAALNKKVFSFNI